MYVGIIKSWFLSQKLYLHAYAHDFTYIFHRFAETPKVHSWIIKCSYIPGYKVLFKIINFSLTISIITLNMNNLNTTAKTTESSILDEKAISNICHLKKTNFKNQDINLLNWKEWEKFYHMYGKRLTQQVWFVQTYTFQRKAYFCDWHLLGSCKLSSWNVVWKRYLSGLFR